MADGTWGFRGRSGEFERVVESTIEQQSGRDGGLGYIVAASAFWVLWGIMHAARFVLTPLIMAGDGSGSEKPPLRVRVSGMSRRTRHPAERDPWRFISAALTIALTLAVGAAAVYLIFFWV